jgi:small-conductance mechanosensitive channel
MMPETAEELSRQPDVRKELVRTTGQKRTAGVKADAKGKFWLVTYGLLIIGCAVLYFLLTAKLIPLPKEHIDLAGRLLRAVALIALVQAISVYAIGRIEDASMRFTLKRIEHLLAALAIAAITISMLFVNWYAALTALGIGSIIIGLAVQTPMKSFIGWIFILVRRPYQVGDRIKIGDATGDVIDVGYLDTTLWEFGGQCLSTDHPSGRVVRFPNEKVLDEMVWNYSWPLFPYIWNEIKFQIAYQSDLKFVAETMQQIVEKSWAKK